MKPDPMPISAAKRDRIAFGARPGMTGIDLFAGGGYYSELLGDMVGADGQVILHNNAASARSVQS